MTQEQIPKKLVSSSVTETIVHMTIDDETHKAEKQMNINFDDIEDILDFNAHSSPKTVKNHKKYPTKLHRKIAQDPVKLLDLKPAIDIFVDDDKLQDLDAEGDGEKELKSKRRFQCITCGNKFIRSTHLHRHMRLHTGVKPYPCPICRRRFSRSDYRSTHQLQHYANKIHCCFVCGQVYLNLTEFADHCSTHDDSEYMTIEMIRTAEKSDANFKRQLLIGRDPVLLATAAEEIVSSACITIEKADNSTVEECVMCVENPMYLPNHQAVAIYQ